MRMFPRLYKQTLRCCLAVFLLASLPPPPAFPTHDAREYESDAVEPPGDVDDFREAVAAPPSPMLPRRSPQGPVAPAARQPAGTLSGRIVYTSAGHGWTADKGPAETTGTGKWYTQRGNNNGMVEDLGNIDQMTMYVFYCFNAGATVVPFRPVGYQHREVVLDNGDASVTFTGTWLDSQGSEYYGNAGDAVSYRYAAKSAVESAVACYRPLIPAADFYPVYTWARDGTDRVPDQLYRIIHSGGATEVRINHRRVGKGWIYLGTYYFETGTAGCVEISNQTDSALGEHVIADAIRFGNGMGDIDRGAGISGKPREDEAARYWVQRSLGQGASTSIYDQTSSNDQDDNVRAGTRLAVWMNRAGEGVMTDRVYLGFHSNAYDPGSLGLYNGNNDPATKTPNQKRWAEIVAAECNDDLVAIGSPPLEYPWPDRRALGRSLTLDRTDIEFGEINNITIANQFDATIIEVAAHGNMTEAYNMRNPRVRDWLARASCQATIRYFNEFGGGPLTMPPEPPTHVAARATGQDRVVISWREPVVDGIGGDAATGYVVYQSHNGYGFGTPRLVAGGQTRSLEITGLAPGATLFFRVAATNPGGESLPSETLAVRIPPAGQRPVLIVNGFDRLNRTMNIRETSPTGIGGVSGTSQTYDRVIPRRSNSYDYSVLYARAAEVSGRAFDSCANECIEAGDVSLSAYSIVLWMLGEESTQEETFSAVEQLRVAEFLDAGGCLLVSGSELAWDLGRASGPTDADRAFLRDSLRVEYAGDDAGSYFAIGAADTLFSGLSLSFAPTFITYDADYPDQLTPSGGSVACAAYSAGGTGTAAVAYRGGTPERRIVVMGIPFETLDTAALRAETLARIFEFFAPDSPDPINGWMLY